MTGLKRKLNVFFILGLLFTLLIGCTNEDENVVEDTSSENGDEPFEISILLSNHTSEVPNGRIIEKLEEITNTNIQIQFIPDDNYQDRLNTAFATGSLPMVVTMNFQMFNQIKDAIRDDQFWEIGDYFTQYENLQKLKPEILANTKVDGKIYSIYQGRPLSRQGIIYRKDWADNLGISQPTTTDDFFEMARAFTEDDPNRTGMNDTIGIADRNDLVYGAFKTIASWHGVPNQFGHMSGRILPEFMFPEYLETLKYMRDIYDNGYINLDFPLTSKNEQISLFTDGTAGIYIGSMADVKSLYNDAVRVNPNVELDVHHYVEGPHGEYGTWAIPGFSNVVMFPKSAIETEEELRKVLAFYDQLMTPEVMNLLMWGLEGEHYEIKNGQALIIDEELFEKEVRSFLSMEVGEPETNGRLERYFNYDVQVKAMGLIRDNERFLIHNPAVVLDSDSFVKDGTRLLQIIEDATINFILGKIDEAGFEEAVEEWKSQGGYKVIEEFTASYRAQSE